jgi:FkbM family methyltransferase
MLMVPEHLWRAAVLGTQAISSRMPRGTGGVLYRFAGHFRRRSISVQVRRFGCTFILDPSEYVDFPILFFPQYYDPEERSLLAKILREGDTFVDVGANVGAYTAMAASQVGASGTIIAIEANPEVFPLLHAMVQRNRLDNVMLYPVAVADSDGEIEFWIQTAGNRGGSTVLSREDVPATYGRSVTVPCLPLSDVVSGPIRLMKLDIEGFETPVLSRYFVDGSPPPDFILTEDMEHRGQQSPVGPLLLANGYLEEWQGNGNRLFRHSRVALPRSG